MSDARESWGLVRTATPDVSGDSILPAQVTSTAVGGDAGWITEITANPIRGTVVVTAQTLHLKATAQPDYPMDEGEGRVGFRYIAIGDRIGYVPYGFAERTASGFDGVVVAHAGDTDVADSGAILTSDTVANVSHFWGTLGTEVGTSATYAWTSEPGYSGAAAAEKNGVSGIAAGTKVRMFGYTGEGTEPAFEYEDLNDGNKIEGGPGIDISVDPANNKLKISADIDTDAGIFFTGMGDAGKIAVCLDALGGLDYGSGGGIEIITGEGIEVNAVSGELNVLYDLACALTLSAGNALQVAADTTKGLAYVGAGAAKLLAVNINDGVNGLCFDAGVLKTNPCNTRGLAYDVNGLYVEISDGQEGLEFVAGVGGGRLRVKTNAAHATAWDACGLCVLYDTTMGMDVHTPGGLYLKVDTDRGLDLDIESTGKLFANICTHAGLEFKDEGTDVNQPIAIKICGPNLCIDATCGLMHALACGTGACTHTIDLANLTCHYAKFQTDVNGHIVSIIQTSGM